jgi:hypothetical protein
VAGDVEKAAPAAGGLDLPGHAGARRSRPATDQRAHVDDRQTRTWHASILPDASDRRRWRRARALEQAGAGIQAGIETVAPAG